MSAVAEARIEMVTQLQGRIATLRRQLASLEDLGQDLPFIVVCEQIPLCFDVATNGDVSNVTAAGSPFSATRFSKADAVRVAGVVRNGNNAPAFAVHVRIAQAAAIREAQSALLLMINAGMPESDD